jgi:predicted PurR-regulated permease PerM
MTMSGRTSLQPIPFYALVLLATYLAYRVLSPFLVPLTWAAVFATVFYGAKQGLSPRIGPGRAALLITLLVAVLIVGPAVIIVAALAQEVPGVVDSVQQASLTTPRQIELVWEVVRAAAPLPLPEDPVQLLRDSILGLLKFLAPHAGAVVANLFATLGSLVAMLFALFFMLRDGDLLARELRDRLPLPRFARDRVMRDTHDLIVASVGAGLVVAVTQGVMAGVVFWLVGIKAPVFWSVVLAFCSLIPVVGAALVWVPAVLWLLLSGEIARGLVLLVVGAFGISLTDNVLRPLILSGRASVNGLVIFFGLLGGASAFGFIGLVIGPIILVVTARLLKMFTDPELAGDLITPGAPEAPS